jgi:hypothetical protein
MLHINEDLPKERTDFAYILNRKMHDCGVENVELLDMLVIFALHIQKEGRLYGRYEIQSTINEALGRKT